ncbi:hypothetical protein ACSVIJ_05965 [Pseudomonas sp. NCHU5208]|uniref:hypothetical protein n=1 Tax=unclassified Pseudomonas TaxID=196821 RepID=UPI003F96C24E
MFIWRFRDGRGGWLGCCRTTVFAAVYVWKNEHDKGLSVVFVKNIENPCAAGLVWRTALASALACPDFRRCLPSRAHPGPHERMPE